MAEPSNVDESTKVLNEYLELFHCLGYRYKYYLAPNALLEWFGTRHVRGALHIHEFLMRKFQSSNQHVNFDKANFCSPIEQNDFQSTTKNLPSHGIEYINPRNKVTGITSLKLRAESDLESDTESTAVSNTNEVVDSTLPTSSSSIVQRTTSELYESDDSNDYSAPSCKRVRYSTPPPTPFKYLRRLPTKRLRSRASDDDSSSDDDDDVNDVNKRGHKKQQIIKNFTSEYSPLRYLEAIGKLRENQDDGDYKEQSIRLRLSYRRNLKNQTIQFALIIYERLDQKLSVCTKRRIRQPDFTKCILDDFSSSEDTLECLDAQPAVILSTTRDGEEHETIATVSTPSSAEIATALEEAAFSIQPPVQRTPTKATPIPPGTPKRRPRSAIVGSMSGIAPLALTSARKLQRTLLSRAPKLNAARSLRL